MRDEIDSRLWDEHHEAFSASIAEGLARLRAVFERLHDHYFCAPWDEGCDNWA